MSGHINSFKNLSYYDVMSLYLKINQDAKLNISPHIATLTIKKIDIK